MGGPSASVCWHCGRPVPRSGLKFCSLSCSAKGRERSRGHGLPRACERCGKEHSTGNKFCSRDCYKLSITSQRTPQTCPSCGRDFLPRTSPGQVTRKQTYCSRSCAGINVDFVGPPHHWTPGPRARMVLDTIPSEPTSGSPYYFDRSRVCSQGHIAPRTVKGNKCVACKLADSYAAYHNRGDPVYRTIKELVELKDLLRILVSETRLMRMDTKP